MLVAFAISVVVCPFLIKLLRRLQFGQQVRDDGPTRHRFKAGTPTAGGVVFLLATAAALLWPGGGWSPLLGAVLLVTLGNGLIGWLDDYAKIAKARSLGLKARNKLLGQFVIAAVFAGLLALSGRYDPVVGIPFTGAALDLQLFYPLFIFLFIIGFSNAVNLTDGIDGLATGTAIITLLAFLYIASQLGMPEIARFCGALVGGCFGFLVYNLHPARIFMGDVGSLALGGALAAVAVLTKTELTLVITGAIFVVETISVILQVISFQLTGKRLFLMSPLHHHFELKGWSEWQVVTAFWGLAFVFAVIGLVQFWRQL
jgi:phospho-N-acetylmuramoyl-pentapeptide-transferase